MSPFEFLVLVNMTLSGERVFADIIKDFAKKPFWIIQENPGQF